MKLLRCAVFAALLATVLAAPGGLPAQAAEPARSLRWSGCRDGFECATLAVPVDYAQPDGATLDLALARLPASGGGARIGSLVVNPGGPGGSGLEFLRSWAKSLDEDVRSGFDIVSFDPRGVGASSPVVCHSNLQAYIAADPTPDDQDEWDNLRRVARDMADECAGKYGSLLSRLGTKDVARDMERIRLALGDSKLTYLGLSYGTEIGQVYADLFPGSIRAMVLDGAVDLSVDGDERARAQAGGFERALQSYLADCRRTNCPLTKRGDPATVIESLLAKVEQASIPARGKDRTAGPGEALLGIITPLYQRAAWPVLTNAITTALDGDGTLLVTLTDAYLGRLPGGSYPNQLEMNIAVSCVDNAPSRLPVDFAAYPAAAAGFAHASPHFGPALANGLGCLDWQAARDMLTAPKGRGAPPILVVSTTGDPATPYEWGVAVSRQLESAVLLTYRGDGHIGYASGDSCVEEQVNRYLLEAKPPPPGMVCGSGAPPTEADGTPPSSAPSRPAPPVRPPATGDDEAVFSDRTSNRSLVRSAAVLAAVGVAAATVTLISVRVRR